MIATRMGYSEEKLVDVRFNATDDVAKKRYAMIQGEIYNNIPKTAFFKNFVAEALIKKGYTLHCFNIGSIASPNSIINGQKLYQFL